MTQPIVIIGGGWAGIAAAVQAIERGRRVVLVEERPYLGGRARSFVDRTTGEVIDNGQHLMMGAYTHALQTIERLETISKLRRQPALHVRFAEPGGHTDVLNAAAFGLQGKIGVALGIMRLRRVSLRGRLAAMRFAIRLQLGWVDPVGKTCLQLLREERQPADVVTRLWEPIILATLNAPMHSAAATLLTTVLSRAFFGGSDASALLIPTDGLSAFIEPLQERIRYHGGDVFVSTSVDAIHVADGRATGVTLSDGRTIPVDGIVCAVPPRALARIAGAPDVELPDMSFSPIVSIYLWYDKAWMDDDFVAVLGTTVQWIFNRRAMVTAAAEHVARYPGHVALTISAGSALVDRPAEEIIAACDTELRTVFSAMNGASLLHGIVIKEKAATFLSTPDVEPRRPHAQTTISNVVLAGDWTATTLPATIEGAAQSGVAAIDHLLDGDR